MSQEETQRELQPKIMLGRQYKEMLETKAWRHLEEALLAEIEAIKQEWFEGKGSEEHRLYGQAILRLISVTRRIVSEGDNAVKEFAAYIDHENEPKKGRF